MRKELDAVTFAWRRFRTSDNAANVVNAELSLLKSSDNVLAEAVSRLRMPTAVPLDYERLVASVSTSERVRDGVDLASAVVSSGAVNAAVETLECGQQRLRASSPITSLLYADAACQSALAVLCVAATAVYHVQNGSGCGAHRPIIRGRAERSGGSRGGASRTAAASTRRPPGASDGTDLNVAQDLLLQLCQEDLWTAYAAYVCAVREERQDHPGADPATAPCAAESAVGGRGSPGAPGVAVALAAGLPLLYHVVHCVRWEVRRQQQQQCGPGASPYIAALTPALERSQVLEVASAALLAVPPPPPPPPLQQQRPTLSAEELQQLERVTRRLSGAVSSLANAMGDLADTARLLGSAAAEEASAGEATNVAPAASGAAGPASAAAPVSCPAATLSRQQRLRNKQLHERLCRLLLGPAPQALQRALLVRFCLNGQATARQGGSGGSGGGGGGCGWPAMDALRLDYRLCDHLYSDHLGTAKVPTLLTLAGPAVAVWSSAVMSPELHNRLPPDLDDLLARMSEASLRLSRGLGESGMFGTAFQLMVLCPLLYRAFKCGALQRHITSTWGAGGESPESADLPPMRCVEPGALEALAWQLEAHVEMAVARMEREAQGGRAGRRGGGAGGTGGGTGGNTAAGPRRIDEVFPEERHWAHMIARVMGALVRILDGWRSRPAELQAEAARRLAPTRLMASLDHALRLYATHAERDALYGAALVAAIDISKNLGAVLLRLQFDTTAAACAEPTADRASGSGNESGLQGSPQAAQPELGLYVTVAKLGGWLAAQLAEATSIAALGGFALHSGSHAAQELTTLRLCVCNVILILAHLCSAVGPAGVDPGLEAAAAAPCVRAVTGLCLRAGLRASAALLDSVEREQRLARRPRGACIFSDTDANVAAVATRVASTLTVAPAFLVSVMASGSPAAEVLSLEPGRLLALCCELACDWAGSGGAGQVHAMRLSVTYSMLETAILAVAAREDIAPHAHMWLVGDSNSGGRGGVEPVARGRLGLAVGQLARARRPLVVIPGVLPGADSQRGCCCGLLAAAATAPEQGQGLPAWEPLRRWAVTSLRQQAVSLSACAEAVSADPLFPGRSSADGLGLEAKLRGFGPLRCCIQALEAAGLGDMEQAASRGAVGQPSGVHGERSQHEQRLVQERQEAVKAPLPRPPPARACHNPSCANFGGACEADLRPRQCSGCKMVRYCSQECLKRDWPLHKPVCLALREAA